MIIAIDIDDCMCNTLEYDFAYGYMLNKKLNPNDEALYEMKDVNVGNTFGFDEKTLEGLYVNQKKHLIKKDTMSVKPFVREVLKKLKNEGHIIFVVTARDNMFWNGNSFKYAKRWLKKNKISYDRLYSHILNKGEFCKNNYVDVLIEDKISHAKEANEKGINSILLLNACNGGYENKLNQYASCWLEIYDKLLKLQDKE